MLLVKFERSCFTSLRADFHGLEVTVIMSALKILVQQRKATLIPGDSVGETGVKFHEV
jgi:hypothetical protein